MEKFSLTLKGVDLLETGFSSVRNLQGSRADVWLILKEISREDQSAEFLFRKFFRYERGVERLDTALNLALDQGLVVRSKDIIQELDLQDFLRVN